MALKLAFNPIVANFDLVQNLTGYIKETDVPTYETDPVFTQWLSDTPPLYEETDPVFSASPAASITNDDLTVLSQTSGTNTGDQDLSNYVQKTAPLPFQLAGDFRGMYISSSYWALIDMETFTAMFPSGITITKIVVKASVADPTTELDANIKYCDAQGNGVFPSTTPTLIAAINTTAGNYDSGAISVSVATNKIVYLEFDADPIDIGVTYRLLINYTVN